jgi:hypothetical protein
MLELEDLGGDLKVSVVVHPDEPMLALRLPKTPSVLVSAVSGTSVHAVARPSTSP